MQRAEVTRSGLVSSGVPGSRIEVISYGKERLFCTDDNEACYQKNRRAQFLVEK
jgi:peptidoglycan-associated lipoprotein